MIVPTERFDAFSARVTELLPPITDEMVDQFHLECLELEKD